MDINTRDKTVAAVATSPVAHRGRRAMLYASVSAMVLASMAAAPQHAFAQQSAAIDEIVVTGSRIARRDFVASSPIVSLTESALQDLGSIELEQKLNYLPQFTPGNTAFNTSLQAANLGQPTLNLRGLGPNRNLVLLDGRRAQPSSSNMQIDLNSIPAALVESVEVISGGASAVYGSDAMSGVINFKLKKDFEGLSASTQYGITEAGDGDTFNAEITSGTNFAGDKGNIVFSLSYYNRKSTPANTRDFNALGRQDGAAGGSSIQPVGNYQPTLAGPIGPADLLPPYVLAGGNAPSAAAMAAIFNTKYGLTGVVPTASNIGFNPDGSLFTQNNGVRNYKGPGEAGGYFLNAAGNQLVYSADISDYTLLNTPLSRYGFFARTSYDLNDDISFFSQAMFTSYQTLTQQAATLAGFNVWNLVIPTTNPFIPADLRTLLASRRLPNDNFGIQKDLGVFGPRVQEHRTVLYQVQAGFTGTIPGDNSWTWEVYATHGRTQADETQSSGGVSYKAVQSLLFAADGGQSICDGGFNPFGDNPVSQDCIDYATRDLPARMLVVQDVAEANLQGGLFELPAGEVRAAGGVSYRRNMFDFTTDSAIQNELPTADYITKSPTAATHGVTDVKEIYGEILIPVAKDVPGIYELTVNPAYRYSDYNTSGGVSTYKVDMNWAIIEPLRARGGYQRAIRSPNIGELFAGPVANPPSIGTTAQGQGDPCDINSVFRAASNPDRDRVRALCIAQGLPAGAADAFVFPPPQVGGSNISNAALTPERADTFTIGAVWQPSFDNALMDRFSISVDYYNIDIKDAINYITGPTALRNCFNALGANPTFDPNSVYCQQITRSAGGQIVNLTAKPVNSGGLKTDGIDFQLDWGFGLGAVGMDDSDGSLSINLVGTYLRSFEVATLAGSPFLDYSGTIGSGTSPLPNTPLATWKWNTTVGYNLDAYTIGARWNYLGKMDSVTTITSPATARPGVGAYSTFDMFGRWAINETLELRGGINNLLDKDPMVVEGNPGQTQTSIYDPLGRRFYVGVNAQF